MSGVFPILVSAEGFEAATNISRPLTASDDPDIPLVAFVRDGGQDPPQFITATAVKKRGHSLQNLEAVARKSLANRTGRPGWEPRNIVFGQGEVTVLIRQGDRYVASDILDHELLKNAEGYFGSQQLFVGLPTPEVMLAADNGLYIHDLVIQAMEQARARGEQPLTARIFCTEAGEITGIAEFADQDVGLPEPRPQPAIYRVQGRNALWFGVRPASGAELCRIMETEFNDYGAELSGWDGFEGAVVFHLGPDSALLTRAERQQVLGLAAALTAKAAQYNWASPYGDPVSVTVQFPAGGAELAGVATPPTPTPTPRPTPAAPPPPPAPPPAGRSHGAKGRKFKLTTHGNAQPSATTAKTGVRLRTTTGGTAATSGQAALAPEAPGLLVPVTARQLRGLMPNQLWLALWAIRLWYLLMILGMLTVGLGAVALLPQRARAAVEAEAEAAQEAAATAKAKEDAARKWQALSAGEADAADEESGTDADAPAAAPDAAAGDEPKAPEQHRAPKTAEPEADDEAAAPAPAKKKRAHATKTAEPEADDEAAAAAPARKGRQATKKVTPAKTTVRTGGAQPVAPAVAAAAAITAAGDQAALAARKLGFFVLGGLAFASLLLLVLQECVLASGLVALRGWARWLGLLQSVGWSLSIVFLPFGAPLLLGLTNSGTVALFAEAKRLRRAQQFRG